MSDEEVKEVKTAPVVEVKEEKTVWEVSGVEIRKGKNDYKFYIGGVTGEYVGALGGNNLDDKKAEERAMRIAIKRGL